MIDLVHSNSKNMSSRRDFISKLGLGIGAISIFKPHQIEAMELADLENDQDAFWYQVQKAFYQSPRFINLENGYFSPQPLETLQAHAEYQKAINEMPSYFMRKMQQEEKTIVKRQLAEFAGVGEDEIVVTRNTTEALDTVILGLKMEKGDEAIMTDQDYLSMVEAFEQKAKRYGTVNKMISLPLHPKSDQEIIDVYEGAITKKTKVMLVTHLINLTGQVLPVRKLCEMAHSHGVEVICDSAHAFAQLDFKIPDLDCDYLGTSLHKWLCTPLGAGMLYVKRGKVHKVWPLFGDNSYAEDDIRKFEHIGTQPVHTHQAISNAIRFHQTIGAERKEKRLKTLRKYWTDEVAKLSKVKLNMPLEDNRSSALGNLSIEGYSPDQLSQYFYEKHGIFTVAINRKTVHGVRVTPHLYTRFDDLDRFIKAVRHA